MRRKLIAAMFAAALLLWTGVAAAQDSKVIKDQAEYNAYIAAFNTQDPAQRGAAFEAFLRQYPKSIVADDALEQALVAYQKSNNVAKVEEIAGRILKREPDNVRVLAILTYIKRARATQGDPNALAEMNADAARGLKALSGWKQPAGISDADFANLKNQLAAVFNGAAGFGALQARDFAKARSYYLKSTQLNPNALGDFYQLGVAELQMEPLDANGFWHIARAIALADAQKNPGAREGIEKFGKGKYVQFHGSEEGWDKILAQAAKQATLPANFAKSVKPAS